MKNKWTYTRLLCLLASLTLQVQAQPSSADSGIKKQTFIFTIKGTDTLSLDKYEAMPVATQKKPIVLFAFGGGFKGGNRAESTYIPFFHFLAKHGFVVVSTDYRTTLKNINPVQVPSPAGFANALQQAISTAVEDFYDATHYIINHSSAWQIDPTQIIASGSSAGAIISLQAEYEICNQTELAKRLPKAFNYAGVIAFAGAISNMELPQWKQLPCPIMMFHGNADRTVPFRQAVVPGLGGLWGSVSIAETLQRQQASYCLYVVDNAGHEIAVMPLKDNKYDVMNFLVRQVLDKKPLEMNVFEKVPGQADVKKDFKLEDYIQNNL